MEVRTSQPSQSRTASRPAAWAVLAIALAAFAFSLHLVRREIGLASPWFGLLLMFCVLGAFALARPVFVPRMPSPLRAIRGWEPAADRLLRVSELGGLLKRPPLRYLNPDVHLKRQQGDARAVNAQVEGAEAAHFWAAWVLVPYIADAAVGRRWGALAALLATEIAMNAYPILHLRLTRARIDGLLLRRHALAQTPRIVDHHRAQVEEAGRPP